MAIGSYFLASWLMRPVGDDYGSLLAYHINASWLSALPDALAHGGGRYAQTIVSVIWYGEFGQKGLRLTGFVSVALFLLAAHLALVAWQKVRGQAINYKSAAVGSTLLFLFYSLLSVVFPWVRGHIDNTFQNFLWLPGLITYTLPFELLAILISSIIICRDKISQNWRWLLLVAGLSVFIGTFSELVPVIFTELLAVIALYCLVRLRFNVKKSLDLLKANLPFVIVEVGLVFGVLLNYLSPGTRARRAIFEDHATITDLITHSVTASRQYVSLHILSHENLPAVFFTVLGGIAIGFAAFKLFKLTKFIQIAKASLGLTGLFAIMTALSIFSCFMLAYKGYGLNPYTYMMPRFEIAYNVWLSLLLVFVGVALAALTAYIATAQKLKNLLPIIYLVLTLVIFVATPFVLRETANRIQSVAVFSSEWSNQDAELREDASEHVKSAEVPVIDIGDAYNIRCEAGDNWLGDVKEEFYKVPKICDEAAQ